MRCNVCQGLGELPCPVCSGDLYHALMNLRCLHCGSTSWVLCPNCKGSGNINVVARWRAQERGTPVFSVWPLTAHEKALLARLCDLHEVAWLHGDAVRAGRVTATKVKLYERLMAIEERENGSETSETRDVQ